jgi:hypothetical protein
MSDGEPLRQSWGRVAELLRRYEGLAPGPPVSIDEITAEAAALLTAAPPEARAYQLSLFWGLVLGAASGRSAQLGRGSVIQIVPGAWSWGGALAIVTAVEPDGSAWGYIPSVGPGRLVLVPIGHRPIPARAFVVIGKTAHVADDSELAELI